MRPADDSLPAAAPQDAVPISRLGVARMVVLGVWASASFGTCYFARDLRWGPDGQPLAYAVAGQGLLILFIAIVLANAAIFRDEGNGEEPRGEPAGRGG